MEKSNYKIPMLMKPWTVDDDMMYFELTLSQSTNLYQDAPLTAAHFLHLDRVAISTNTSSSYENQQSTSALPLKTKMEK
eukprot:2996643-Ditylum_brightwellii.AAC.1